MSNAWVDAGEWPLRLVIGKDLPERHRYGRGFRIVVTAGLVSSSGAPPYWSCTAEIIDCRRPRHYDVVCVGPLESDVRLMFPELERVQRLHLADADGTPMHVYDNARYWLGLTEFRGTADGEPLPDADGLARHLRCEIDEAWALIERHRVDTPQLDRDIDRFRPRWEVQAAEAERVLIELGAVDRRPRKEATDAVA